MFEDVVKTLEQLDRAPRTVSIEVWVAEVVTKKGEDGKPVEGEKEIDLKEFTGTIEEVQAGAFPHLRSPRFVAEPDA